MVTVTRCPDILATRRAADGALNKPQNVVDCGRRKKGEGQRFRSRTRFRFAMSRDSHRKCRQHATVRNIWMNAIFYFHILLLLLPYNGPDHTPTHAHSHIKGDFRFIQVASFSSVGVLRLRWGKWRRGLQSIRRH